MEQMLQRFINDLAAQKVMLEQQQSHYTVSIGWLCQVPGFGQTTAQWLAAADTALYQAKAQGRNGAVQNRTFSLLATNL
jgi:diguanylate cyclase (GGDEF)-like protein